MRHNILERNLKFNHLKVLRVEDKKEILAFESQMQSKDLDPLAFMKNWSAPWREESLDHYLKLGWSMAHIENNEVKGYILVQPVLFFGGLTQSLWVELVRASTSEIAESLFEAVIRVSKEKHLQQVFFNSKLLPDFEMISKQFNIETHSELAFVKTTRWEA